MGNTVSSSFSGKKIASSVGIDNRPGVDLGFLHLCKDIKQVEYLLFLGAMYSRLAYCDVGIMQESLKAMNRSPDILNNVITSYDWKYLSLRRSYTKGVPAPDSYTTINSCKTPIEPKDSYLKYISSPIDTTCIVCNPSISGGGGISNSILRETDCIIAFKGSSSVRNWIANLSTVKAWSLNEALKKGGLEIQASPDFKVTTSYLTPVLEILNDILAAISLVSPGCTRIFVFGHSKGGAEAEMMGMLLTLMLKKKENFKALGAVTDVHVISYGAPKVLAASAYNDFNTQILSSQSTLTRVESVGRLVGDVVTTMPPLGKHPGASDGNNTIDVVRGTYGAKVDGNYRRNAETWPFSDHYDLWSRKEELKKETEKITSFTFPTDEEVKKLEDSSTTKDGNVTPQQTMGGYYIKVKGARNTPFSHVEQLGMYFMGSQRLAGMKNPANTKDNRTFTAVMNQICSTYEYIPYKNIVNIGGRRKTYRKPKRQLKKTRRG